MFGKSTEHHKAILQCCSVLYQNLSGEVADAKGEISGQVAGIYEHISTFQESMANELAALQDSINRWPDSYRLHMEPTHDSPTLFLELGSLLTDPDLSCTNTTNDTGWARDDISAELLVSNSERDGDCTGSTVIDDLSQTPYTSLLARFAFLMWTKYITVPWSTISSHAELNRL